MRHVPICVFGEVLFDRFPEGRAVLGGAPFNVAWHLNALGERPYFKSAVGNDAPGRQIRAAMLDWGMEVQGLDIDPDHPTGVVTITLIDGEPNYDIVAGRAYDHIKPAPSGLTCELLYHGTLALRGPLSAQALESFKAQGPDTIFLDVNLRPPWWDREQVIALVEGADWVKLNRDELNLLSGASGHQAEGDLQARARTFAEAHGLQGLILTLGAQGALGLTAAEPAVTVAPPADIQVVDVVGAGDAFAAVAILGIRRGWPLGTTLERAQSFAARIVSQPGATAADRGLYQPFIELWGLEREP